MVWWIMEDAFSFVGIIVVSWVLWQGGALFLLLNAGDLCLQLCMGGRQARLVCESRVQHRFKLV
jgi:hypothetical protein